MKKIIAWIQPFATFGLAMTILLGWIYLSSSSNDGSLFRFFPIIVYFVFWLIIEAASQADPNQVPSPLGKFLAGYSNTRDRIVATIANAAVLFCLLFLYSSPFETRPDRSLLWLLMIAITALTYYGICMLFGTRELREKVIPKALKRMFNIPK